jgi:sulfate transport system permease protein
MSSGTHQVAATLPRPAFAPRLGSALLSRGIVTTWLSLIVLAPIVALTLESFNGGFAEFWQEVTSPQALGVFRVTLLIALGVTAINCVVGTAIAWVLVRDEFPGKGFLNSVIDLPFALPTIVAGITLLALYGNGSPLGVDIARTVVGVALALLFVTLPFVVRTVQPTLIELDRDMEEAAASLGASNWTIFRTIVLPNLRPAILAGAALAFARAIGEFGSLVLLAGNIQIASIYIFAKIGSGDQSGAAAVSIVLLLISIVILLVLGGWARRGGARNV